MIPQITGSVPGWHIQNYPMKAGALVTAAATVGLLFFAAHCPAALYYGTGSTSPNNTVSGGSLQITESGYNNNNINLTFTRGDTYFSDVLVFYFDSIPGEGFSGTSQFIDRANTDTRMISGVGQFGSSTVNFANGFGADYALVLEVGTPLHGLYRLSNAGDGSMTLIRSVTLDAQQSSSQINTSFTWNDLGIGAGASRGFRFQSTYLTLTGSRYLESFEHIGSGSSGGLGGTIWFSDYNLYGVDPVPEPTTVALVIFGGLVLAGAIINHVRHLAPIFLGRSLSR